MYCDIDQTVFLIISYWRPQMFVPWYKQEKPSNVIYVDTTTCSFFVDACKNLFLLMYFKIVVLCDESLVVKMNDLEHTKLTYTMVKVGKMKYKRSSRCC